MALDAEQGFGEALRKGGEATRAEGFFRSSHEKACQLGNQNAAAKSAVSLGISKGEKAWRKFGDDSGGRLKLPSLVSSLVRDERNENHHSALGLSVGLQKTGIVEAM